MAEKEESKRNTDSKASWWERITWILAVAIPLFLAVSILLGNWIKSALIEQLDEQLQVRVDVNNIQFSGLESFPMVGIRLEQVHIQESQEAFLKNCLDAGQIIIKVNPFDLLGAKKEIHSVQIYSATFRLLDFENGSSNYEILREDNSSSEGFELDLHKISLLNTRLIYQDQSSRTSINVFCPKLKASGSMSDERFELDLNLRGLFDHINISGNNLVKGKWADFDLALLIDQNLNSYHLNKASIKLEDLSMEASGDILVFNESPEFDIELQGEDIQVQGLVSILPNKYRQALENYRSSGSLAFSCKINGRIDAENPPEVDMQYEFVDYSLSNKQKGFMINELSSRGKIKSIVDNERLVLSWFDTIHVLKLANSQLSAICQIKDIRNPFLKFESTGTLNLKDLNALIDPELGIVMSGVGPITIKGGIDLSGDINAESMKNIEGMVDMKNFGLNIEKIIELSEASLQASIQNADLQKLEYQGKLNDNFLLFNGSLGNWMGFTSEQDRATLRGDISSQKVDIGSFFQEESSEDSSSAVIGEPDLDIGLDLDIKLICEELIWDQLKASVVTGTIGFTSHQIKFDDISMKAWEGQHNWNGRINANKSGYEFNGFTHSKDFQINQLMEEFDNFGQSDITSDHLSGKVNTEAHIKIPFDADFNSINRGIVALAYISVVDGSIEDYKPLESLSTFAELEDLKKIKFEELNNTVQIDKGIITIPTMTVKNNVLDIAIEGSHTLDNYMNYSLEVEIDEILAAKTNWMKKRKERQIDEQEDGGMKAYIVMQGTPDDLKIKYDRKKASQKVREEIKRERKSFFDQIKKDIKGDKSSDDKRKARWDE